MPECTDTFCLYLKNDDNVGSVIQNCRKDKIKQMCPGLAVYDSGRFQCPRRSSLLAGSFCSAAA
ncbi:hypothetical protein QQ045_032198 [Rhodiola kirilowii]